MPKILGGASGMHVMRAGFIALYREIRKDWDSLRCWQPTRMRMIKRSDFTCWALRSLKPLRPKVYRVVIVTNIMKCHNKYDIPLRQLTLYYVPFEVLHGICSCHRFDDKSGRQVRHESQHDDDCRPEGPSCVVKGGWKGQGACAHYQVKDVDKTGCPRVPRGTLLNACINSVIWIGRFLSPIQ